jgi:hypothetical protein
MLLLIPEDGKRVESNTTMKNNPHRESSQLGRKCSIILDMPSPSVGTVVTTSYLYDVNNERIALGANGATTTYPFKLYNVNGNTIYKHIFANGEPVADVQGSTTTAQVYYIHDDHLGGSSVISDASVNVAQVLEYYPFDGTTNLNYLNARYQDPVRGQFLSEDPVFLNVSNTNITGVPAYALTGLTALFGSTPSSQALYLASPQAMNAYSYSSDNPISYKDPDGKQLVPIIFAAIAAYGYAQTAIDAYDAYITDYKYSNQFSKPEKMQSAANFGVDLFTMGVSSGAKKIGMEACGVSLDVIGTASGVLQTLDGIKRKDQSIQVTMPGTSGNNLNLPRFTGGGYSNPSFYSFNSNVYSSSPQTRYNAVQTYNTSSGASSNESKLWVTPSGAVITWGDGVVVAAPSSKR